MDRLNFPLYRACMDPWSEVRRRCLEHSLIGSTYDVVAVVDPPDQCDARHADPPVPHEPCQHRLQLLPLPLPGGEEEKQHRCSAIRDHPSIT